MRSRDLDGDRLYRVQFESTPGPHHPETDETAGAIVNCWIVSDSAEAAIEVARRGIVDAGWLCGDPDDVAEVDMDSIDETHDGYQYIEQALIDHEVYVFHCWPVDEEEGLSPL